MLLLRSVSQRVTHFATNMGTSSSRSRASLELAILLQLFSCSSIFPSPCDATRTVPRFTHGEQPAISLMRKMDKMKWAKNLDLPSSSNTEPYGVSSPFTLPPYDSLSPISLPDLSPPYCIFPPFPTHCPYTPTPSTPYIYFPPEIPTRNPPPGPPESFPYPNPPETIPISPIPRITPSPSVPRTVPSPPFAPQPPCTPTPSTPYIYFPPVIPIRNPPPSPPESFPYPNPPETIPISPVPGTIPSPSVPRITPSPSAPRTVPSPPFHIPSPTTFAPTPPSYVPSPGGGEIMPRPPTFLPPIVYPPPTVPPPPNLTPSRALWCVVKPSVPDPIVQEAMNYACGSGADCSSIQPEGSCFQPNTLFAHASYAFNSYWQRIKVAGGSCSFGGTAMLVTVDPSFDGCHFVYY